MGRNNAAEAGVPEIIAITDQNRHLISDSLGGIIVLPNGTIKLTPQFLTKQKNPNVQRMKKYPTRPTQTPECVRALDGHPQPSDLNLIWTHDGEWAKIPIERNARLHEDTPHEIVRVQSYIDEEGVIRKAVCYERIDLKLEVWYRYGDIQQYYPNWEIHKPSLFYNVKRWRDDVPHYLNKAKKAKNVANNQKKPQKLQPLKTHLQMKIHQGPELLQQKIPNKAEMTNPPETSPAETFKEATNKE